MVSWYGVVWCFLVLCSAVSCGVFSFCMVWCGLFSSSMLCCFWYGVVCCDIVDMP